MEIIKVFPGECYVLNNFKNNANPSLQTLRSCDPPPPCDHQAPHHGTIAIVPARSSCIVLSKEKISLADDEVGMVSVSCKMMAFGVMVSTQACVTTRNNGEYLKGLIYNPNDVDFVLDLNEPVGEIIKIKSL